jgi:pimeloyl-ACP methyl ester carboxylesterase
METVRSADGTTIAFDRGGSGPSLVVVGGALSDRGAVNDLAARIGDDLTVIAYDRRGRGDSTDTPPYAIEREIEDLAALLDAAGGSAFVHGHSSGAVLALRSAEAGVPIARLSVYEPPLAVDTLRPAIPDAYVPHLEELVATGRRGDAVTYFLTVGPLLPPPVIEQLKASPAWPGMEAVAHTIAYDGRIMDGLMTDSPAPLRRWASLATPTLVLDGGASPPWIRNGASALADVLPNATRATLDGQGHGPAAEVLAPELVRFFVTEAEG